MSITDIGLNRYKLGFIEEVLTQYDFLIKEYKFQCVKKDVTFVRYESKNVFINIYHGRISYELGFQIGLLTDKGDIPEQHYTLSEIIESEGALDDTGYTYLQASTKEALKISIPRMAELVRKYAANYLLGNVTRFEKLALIQKRRSDEYIKEMELKRIRPKAEKAWQNKKYKEFVDLLEPIEKELEPSEFKKLQYARKHS